MAKVAIIGAGAAGLCLAGLLQQRGESVVVLDGNEKAGKKLYITGKGRCNLTNLCAADEFLKNIVRGEKFMRTAIYNFDSFAAVEFFEGLGLATKVERGNRVFPQSDKSSDVIKALNRHCKGVEFRFNQKVLGIKNQNGKFVVKTLQNQEEFDKVVIATGGKSYSATGSTGDGFAFARAFGHNVVDLKPALCPIKLKDDFVKALQGVSLKNVQINALADGRKLSFFGEMMFTDQGITGPIVLTLSSHINRAQNVSLSVDFKPTLSQQQLDARLLRDFETAKNKEIKSVFRGLLPKAVADVFAKVVEICEEKKVSSITKQERAKIVQYLKSFPIDYDGLYNMEAGIVTSGGVDVKEINPKTFESKLQSGLYFVGEVLDVDALTGGFNLQCCWAQAYSCAKNWR